MDDEFEIPNDSIDEEMIEIEIPDDPTLDTIIELSLKAYKDQMEDIIHVEVKNRSRYLEVAEKFLAQAKDAMYKKEQIRLKREQYIKGKGSQSNPINPTDSGDSTDSQSSSVNRNDLNDKVRKLRGID